MLIRLKRGWWFILTFILTNTCSFLAGMWFIPYYSLGYYSRHYPVASPSVHRQLRHIPVTIDPNTNNSFIAGHNELVNPDEASFENLPTIFAITPTYKRLTQKVDLTSLCQTLMFVPKLHWVVVEDSTYPTDLVSNLLSKCNVTSTHLITKRSEALRLLFRDTWKGIEQRNLALDWLRTQCGIGLRSKLTKSILSSSDCEGGVVYYADDDNKYDLRLFDMIRSTRHVSMWPVAFSGKLLHEGPICSGERISAWHTAFAREIPIDMAGFATVLQLILQNSRAGFTKGRNGFLETDFLGKLGVTQDSVKCYSLTEALVWHVQTRPPDLSNEPHFPSDTHFIT